MNSRWIVICLLGAEECEQSHYVIATRTAFRTREGAERFTSTIHESRKAIVVEAPLGVGFRDDAAERFGYE